MDRSNYSGVSSDGTIESQWILLDYLPKMYEDSFMKLVGKIY